MGLKFVGSFSTRPGYLMWFKMAVHDNCTLGLSNSNTTGKTMVPVVNWLPSFMTTASHWVMFAHVQCTSPHCLCMVYYFITQNKNQMKKANKSSFHRLALTFQWLLSDYSVTSQWKSSSRALGQAGGIKPSMDKHVCHMNIFNQPSQQQNTHANIIFVNYVLSLIKLNLWD